MDPKSSPIKMEHEIKIKKERIDVSIVLDTWHIEEKFNPDQKPVKVEAREESANNSHTESSGEGNDSNDLTVLGHGSNGVTEKGVPSNFKAEQGGDEMDLDHGDDAADKTKVCLNCKDKVDRDG